MEYARQACVLPLEPNTRGTSFVAQQAGFSARSSMRFFQQQRLDICSRVRAQTWS